jgi:hypothetical protein
LKEMTTPPDFSAKALGIDGPSSVKPLTIQQAVEGPGLNIFKPGTVGLLSKPARAAV